jgi:hypothetical protein
LALFSVFVECYIKCEIDFFAPIFPEDLKAP